MIPFSFSAFLLPFFIFLHHQFISCLLRLYHCDGLLSISYHFNFIFAFSSFPLFYDLTHPSSLVYSQYPIFSSSPTPFYLFPLPFQPTSHFIIMVLPFPFIESRIATSCSPYRACVQTDERPMRFVEWPAASVPSPIATVRRT